MAGRLGVPEHDDRTRTWAQYLRRLHAPHPVAVPDERARLLATVLQALQVPGARVLLVGEPGVGRSRVLGRVERLAEECGVRLLRARPSRSTAGTPFAALVDLFAGVDDAHLAGLPDLQREALEVALSRRPGRDALPLMALRLAVAAVLADLQRCRRVLVSVDDWDWLDAESADVLAYVLTRPTSGGGPALVATQVADAALSGRGCPVDRALFPPASVFTVPPLGIQALGAVLAEKVGAPLPADQLAGLHRASGGNPLWAMELLDRPARALLTAGPGPELPGSIADAVLGRVQALPAPELEVLAACAAAGGASADQVIALSGQDAGALAAAAGNGVVTERDGRVVPAHQLLGAAALRAVGVARQLELHARAAGTTPSLSEHAWQLDQAVLPGPDPDVAAALDAAVEESSARGATASALAQAERAVVRTAPTAPERDGRLVTLAETAVAAASFARASTVLTELDLLRLDVELLDRALPLLVDAIAAERGDDAVQQVLADLVARAGGDPLRLALVDVRAVPDRAPVPDRRARAGRALAVLDGHPEAPAARHRALTLLLTADLDAGRGLDRTRLAQMRELEPQLRALGTSDTADAYEGFYAYQVDDLATSRARLAPLAERAEEMGEDVVAAVFRLHLAVVESMTGHPDRAAAQLARFDAVDPWGAAPPPIVVRAKGLLAISRGDGAAVDALVSAPHQIGTPVSGRIARLVLRGSWEAAHERWAEALPPLQEAHALAESRGFTEPGRRLWLDAVLGPVLVALARTAEAERLAEGLTAAAAAPGRPFAAGQQLRLRGLLSAAGGDLGTATGQLREAAALFREGGVPVEHARCLVDLGRVLRRRRARAEARATLEEALAVAVRIDHRPLAALVRAELDSSRSARSAGDLTPAEQRVAEGAARGLSNREIATAEFVSVRTVEAQLSAAYRKLGVRSRTQLAARLRED